MQKKINSLKMKRVLKYFFKYIEKVSWAITVIIILGGLVFLYNNCYQALNNISFLTILRNQVAVKVIDMEKWEKINNDLEWKKQPLIEGEQIRNPFE